MKLKNTILGISIPLLLAGCITIGEETEPMSNEPDETEDLTNDEVELETPEEETNEEESALDESAVSDVPETDEELPGLNLTVLELDKLLYDLEEIEGYDPSKHIVLEYDQTLFFSNDILSDVLNLNVNYDADNFFSEIFEGEGTYTHEMVNTDRSSSILEVNEYWRFDYDDYWTSPGDTNYNYLEYDGQLFIPDRVVEMIGDTPVYRDRQANIIELGESSTEVYLNTLNYNDRSHTTATPRDSLTFEGENLGPGFDLEIGYFHMISSGGQLIIDTEGKKKTAYLTLSIKEIPSGSDSTDISITTGHEGKEKTEVFTVSEGDQKEIEIDIGGSNYINMETDTKIIMYLTGYVK
ncbi:hypothetical protein [Bacillus sp. JCM 19034]|uniref:hypothetical protein n=1 Tax=Bacillus sp. JCM 19034 TaxID=1481928 RepID=UPI0007852304|nr:hypothetical protein [Bacillus sp. JCM 19034]